MFASQITARAVKIHLVPAMCFPAISREMLCRVCLRYVTRLRVQIETKHPSFLASDQGMVVTVMQCQRWGFGMG